MEKPPKVVPFPNPAERKEIAGAKARAQAIDAGILHELYAPLDTAKAIGVQRIIEEEAVALPGRFSAENLTRAKAEVEKLAVREAIKELNEATEQLVRLDPIRYVALLEHVRSVESASTDDQ